MKELGILFLIFVGLFILVFGLIMSDEFLKRFKRVFHNHIKEYKIKIIDELISKAMKTNHGLITNWDEPYGISFKELQLIGDRMKYGEGFVREREERKIQERLKIEEEIKTQERLKTKKNNLKEDI